MAQRVDNFRLLLNEKGDVNPSPCTQQPNKIKHLSGGKYEENHNKNIAQIADIFLCLGEQKRQFCF